MKRAALAIIILIAGICASLAQSATVIGPITPGDCAFFNSTTVLKDAGFSCNGAPGNAITALTGDGTATGPGSVPFTLATVNGNVGSFGSATSCVALTVNAKGLITAISAATCTPAIGSISGLGANVATALGIGVGSVGAFITNLTGPITSTGNATSVASQTGTGSTFVMNTSPVLVTPTLGVALATSLQFSPSTGGIIGTPTNNNASGGVVGEYISSSIASGSAVALTTGVAANVTSISLTAGDWDVSAEVNFIGGATTTVGIFAGSISGTSGTMSTPPAGGYYASTMFNNVGLSTFNPTCPLSPVRLSIGGTSTIFLIGFMNFATSTASAFGFIGARRIR